MLLNISEKYRKVIVYIIVIFISSIVFIGYGRNKRISYADEIYTYTIVNAKSAFVQFPVGQWVSRQYMVDDFSHDSGDTYGHMLDSVKFDKVHPPLYYTLLYMLFSIFEGSTSIWIPLLLNLFFYLGSITLAYCFLYKIFRKPWIAATSVLLAFNIGVISAAMFIRMYMMLTFFVLAFIYVNYLIWINRRRWYLYILIFVITVCGFLTQYYFALFAAGCYITEFLYDIVKKKYISLLGFTMAMVGSVMAATLIWKEWVRDIFGNVHSQSMFDKTGNIASAFLANIPRTIQFLYGTPFRNLYLPAFVIIFAGIIYIIFSKKMRESFNSDIRYTLVKMYIAANFNALVITELAPDYLLSNRYYYAPAAVITIVGMVMIFMAVSSLNNKKLPGIVVAAMAYAILNIYVISANDIDYYTDAKEYDSNIALLRQYEDIPWIIGGAEGWITRNHLEQFMIPYTIMLVDDETPGTDDEVLENEEEFLLLGYDDNVKFSDIGLKYYVDCTGNDYEEQQILVWNSLYVYLVKKK